jgi:hypothetical protein
MEPIIARLQIAIEQKTIVPLTRSYDSNFMGDRRTVTSAYINENELATIFQVGRSMDEALDQFAAVSFARQAGQAKRKDRTDKPPPVNSGNMFR